MQTNAWPMAPSLEENELCSGPSTLDGINEGEIFLKKVVHLLNIVA